MTKILITTNNGHTYQFFGDDIGVDKVYKFVLSSMNGDINTGHVQYNGTLIRMSDISAVTVIFPWYRRLFVKIKKFLKIY